MSNTDIGEKFNEKVTSWVTVTIKFGGHNVSHHLTKIIYN